MKKVVLFLCVLLCTYIAFTEENPQLAVVRFSSGDATRAQEIATTVRNLVESKMVASGEYDVIAREEIDLLLENQQIQLSSISSQENLKKLQLQNISYIVTGTIDILDDSCIVTIRLLEVDSGKFTNSTNGIMKNDVASLFQGTTTLTDNLIAGQTVAGGAIAQTGAVRSTYSIGDIGPGGGLVFYKYGNLVYEFSEKIANAKWENAKKLAKNYRGGGYSDWYLPSKGEFDIIYRNIGSQGFIMDSDWYWSSSEGEPGNAWYYTLDDGYHNDNDKNWELGVRAIRFFVLQSEPQQNYSIDTYQVGDMGPGGGIVFYKEGDSYLETSRYLGEGTWYDALSIVSDFRGGDYDDWILPNKRELDVLYNNLRRPGIILDNGWLWSNSGFERGGGPEESYRSGSLGVLRNPIPEDNRSSNGAWAQNFSNGYSGDMRLDGNNVLGIRAIRAFNTIPQVHTLGNVTHSFSEINDVKPIAQTQQVKKTYRLGEVGPGGGLIFHFDGNTYYECSPILGSGTWEEAVIIANNYTGGGYNDWGLPTNDELLLLYSNLRAKNFIRDTGIIWGAEDYKDNGKAIDFSLSYKQIKLYYKLDVLDIRAVRAFNVE